MATEALVARIKEIVALGKSGNRDDAFKGYAALFRSAEFRSYPMDEQRQAIKLVVNIKVAPNRPSHGQMEAFKAAIDPLSEMLGAHGASEDFQWLGICCMVTGDEKRAGE